MLTGERLAIQQRLDHMGSASKARDMNRSNWAAIAANALVFGVLNALIWHPQIAQRPESLYAVQRGADRAPERFVFATSFEYDDK